MSEKLFLATVSSDREGASYSAEYAVIPVTDQDIERWQAWAAMAAESGLCELHAWDERAMWLVASAVDSMIGPGYQQKLREAQGGSWTPLAPRDAALVMKAAGDAESGVMVPVGSEKLELFRGPWRVLVRFSCQEEDSDGEVIWTPWVALNDLARWFAEERPA